MVVEIIGYIVWCVLTVWVCAGAFATAGLSMLSGRVGAESILFILVALSMLFGVYSFWPFS